MGKIILSKHSTPEEKCLALLSLTNDRSPEARELLKSVATQVPVKTSPRFLWSRTREYPADRRLRAAAYSALTEDCFTNQDVRGHALLFMHRNDVVWGELPCPPDRDSCSSVRHLLDRGAEVLHANDASRQGQVRLAFQHLYARHVISPLPSIKLGHLDPREPREVHTPGKASSLQAMDFTVGSVSDDAAIREALLRTNCQPLAAAPSTPVSLEQIAASGDLFEAHSLALGFIKGGTFRQLIRNQPSVRKALEQALQSLECSSLTFFAEGGAALVMRRPDGVLIRFRLDDPELAKKLGVPHAYEPPRINHPAILLPTRIERVGPVKVEYWPEVKTEGVTQEDVKAVIEALTTSGLHLELVRAGAFSPKAPGDIRIGNVGLLPDGTPVAFDTLNIFAPPIGSLRKEAASTGG